MSLMRSDDLQLCIKSGTQKKQQGHNFTLSVDLVLPLCKGIVGIFGKSGAGKSTLLRVLSGLEKADLEPVDLEKKILKKVESKIHWQDKRIDKLPADKNPCLLQTQQAQLFPNLTVLANLTFVIKHSAWANSCSFTFEQVIQWCGIEHLLTQPSTSLSGGEQQRVNLSRSLLSGKPIILLDEPFSALDWNARVELLG
jgi:molybdate transport system ATP-binding protein